MRGKKTAVQDVKRYWEMYKFVCKGMLVQCLSARDACVCVYIYRSEKFQENKESDSSFLEKRESLRQMGRKKKALVFRELVSHFA